MAVVPCFVVVDLPTRKVFLLQAVHRIAEWLCLESAVLRGRPLLGVGCVCSVRITLSEENYPSTHAQSPEAKLPEV